MKALVTRSSQIADPPFAKFLFSDTRMAVVWLIVREAMVHAGLIN